MRGLKLYTNQTIKKKSRLYYIDSSRETPAIVSHHKWNISRWKGVYYDIHSIAQTMHAQLVRMVVAGNFSQTSRIHETIIGQAVKVVNICSNADRHRHVTCQSCKNKLHFGQS